MHLRGSLQETRTQVYFPRARRDPGVYFRIGPSIIISLSDGRESANVSAEVTTVYGRKIVAQFWSPARTARRVPPVSHPRDGSGDGDKSVWFSQGGMISRRSSECTRGRAALILRKSSSRLWFSRRCQVAWYSRREGYNQKKARTKLGFGANPRGTTARTHRQVGQAVLVE